MEARRWRLGAIADGDGVTFRAFAPSVATLEVALEGGAAYPMERDPRGIFSVRVEGASAGLRYQLRLGGDRTLPDPASRFQPEGVHGPSEVVDPAVFRWSDAGWPGVPLADLSFYELHVGTFSPEGTFDGARRRLPSLRDLGVTAIELMPIHDFPGRWNWGYDPAAFYAPARAYGRPDDLRALVDEAHALGLAVFVDVVYNHLGPDGAYAAACAPMLTEAHGTPWGAAVNLDQEHSAGVRAFFMENALCWLEEYHADGLRLDAVFALVDDGPVHFLAELAERVAELPGPKRILVAEDNRNLTRLVEPRERGGYGLDAIWADDFHHLVRRLATGDRHGYFAEYPVSLEALARCIEAGWHFCGEPRGSDPSGLGPERFVICIQNHDQVGNRPQGDRLHPAIDLPLYRALSALLLFCPELPLLFMGQEWAASSPFQFFTDHEPELGRAVTEGRKREHRGFPGAAGEVPDPQDPETFLRSALDWQEREREPHAGVLRLYRDLFARRRTLAGEARARAVGDVLLVDRGRHRLVVAFAGGAEVALGAGEVLWHSEEGAYSEAPRPPQLADGAARFPVPAALLLELRT